MVHIAHIADHLDLLPLIGRWHWDEWGQHDPEGSLESWTAGLGERVHRDRVPCTVIGFVGDTPIGTAVLVEHDMDTRLDLTPWLAGVYVERAQRGRGVGSALVRHAMNAAHGMGVSRLYLYTNGSEKLYASLGWESIGREPYEGRLTTLMSADLSGSVEA